ncbi:MAG: GHKL domain-containing protein [Clostridia bacterium]|nr:GHKL domain-containing protein [Clostridia bacterium]
MPSSVLTNIPRLYTAVAEWLACVLVIVNADKRFNKWQTALIIIAALAVFVGFHLVAELLPIGFWIPCMILAVVIMCGFIWLTVKRNVKVACYLGVQAFIVAEFAASAEWWLYYFFAQNFPAVASVTGNVLFAVFVYAGLFTALFFIERHFNHRRLASVTLKDIFTAVVIVVTAFLISNISFMHWNTPLSSKYALEIFYIRTIVDLCGLLVLYSNRQIKNAGSAEAELTQIRLLLARQYEQYCITKEAIDSVNRRYHDLKHQVALIREKGTDAAEMLVAEIENETKLYDLVYNTGNEILNTILMSKSMLCVQKGITFTCVADGNALNFISEVDICSLFGNALDNAIESFEESDIEARLIKLAVYKNNGLLIIRCENTFNGQLKTRDGELLTTKRERQNHGYGVKSIKTVAEKYGGTVNYAVNDGIFSLGVVIPVKI